MGSSAPPPRSAADAREDVRKDALTAFIEDRLANGYTVETRTDTHAIVVPVRSRWSFLDRILGKPRRGREVISVDEHGNVTAAPAEPLRS